jgi:G3E family GTPase
VSSVSITQDGELDLALVEAWIGDLLQTKATDMYRMKGVLNIRFGARAALYSNQAPCESTCSHLILRLRTALESPVTQRVLPVHRTPVC